MPSSREKADLRAINIDYDDAVEAEVEQRLMHLEWLERGDSLPRMLQLSSLELEGQADSLDEKELLRRRSIINQAMVSGMRLEDGSLSTPFLRWYETFCEYDSNGVIRYSPRSIERGDHPHATVLDNSHQTPSPSMTTGPVPSDPPATHSGGKPGRKELYNNAVDYITGRILERQPDISPENAWERFFNEAPDWQAPNEMDTISASVTFERDPSAEGDAYLRMYYHTAKMQERQLNYNRDMFKRRLRKLRSTR